MLANYGQIKESCDNCDNCLNNIREQKIIKSNYYIPTYLFLKVLEKFNGKFGSGIIINILLGKKVKEDFKQLNEYGSGTPFGNINWWKNLFLTLKLNDFISSKQIKGSFGSSISLSNKSMKWLNAQKEKYRDSILLLTDTNFKEELLFEQIDSSNEKISKKIKNTKIEKNVYV